MSKYQTKESEHLVWTIYTKERWNLQFLMAAINTPFINQK